MDRGSERVIIWRVNSERGEYLRGEEGVGWKQTIGPCNLQIMEKLWLETLERHRMGHDDEAGAYYVGSDQEWSYFARVRW